MDDVVLVAVTQRLEDLSHVVAVKREQFSSYSACGGRTRPPNMENNRKWDCGKRAILSAGRFLLEDFNSAIGRLAMSHNDTAKQCTCVSKRR
jgi:hypothetical protein